MLVFIRCCNRFSRSSISDISADLSKKSLSYPEIEEQIILFKTHVSYYNSLTRIYFVVSVTVQSVIFQFSVQNKPHISFLCGNKNVKIGYCFSAHVKFWQCLIRLIYRLIVLRTELLWTYIPTIVCRNVFFVSHRSSSSMVRVWCTC